jgi:hypothetical protein
MRHLFLTYCAFAAGGIQTLYQTEQSERVMAEFYFAVARILGQVVNCMASR